MADITDIVHRTKLRVWAQEQDGKGIVLVGRDVYTAGDDSKPDSTQMIARVEFETYEKAESAERLLNAGIRIGIKEAALDRMFQPYLHEEVNHLPWDPSCN